MKFKTKKSELVKGLKPSLGIAEKKTTMPILSNVLINAKEGQLSVSATDLEIGVISCCEADVEKEGKVVVSAKNLYEIVRELPNQEIRFQKGATDLVEVQCGAAQFKIVSMPAEEFPNLPEIKGKQTVQLTGKILIEMLERTLFSVSNDETRYVLNGVLFETPNQSGKKNLRMVATDGHRLSFSDRAGDGKFQLPQGIVIPKKGIVELKKMIEETGSETLVSVSVGEKGIIFKQDAVTLFVRLIEGEFPVYDQIIPKKASKIIDIERSAFMGALKRAQILSLERTRGVKLTFSPGLVEVASKNPDLGEASEELPVNYKGEVFEIGFNAKYLLDTLGVIEDERVTLEFNDESSPCVVKSQKDQGFLSLIMPMRI